MNRLQRKTHSAMRGTTLVEVMAAVVITVIVGLSIIASMTHGVEMQQRTREYNAASRIAQGLLEESKRQFFLNLKRRDIDDILMDNRGTSDSTDDIFCDARVQFFDLAGNEIGTVANPIPLDLSMIRAVATVEWNPAGRRSTDLQDYAVATLIAP